MNSYNVLLIEKHGTETHTIQVGANSEDEAMNIVDNLIDTDDNYREFRSGWKIVEAFC